MNERIRKIIANAIWEWPSLQTLDLSKDTLTLEDYTALGKIIKNARYLESVKLPQLPCENLESILEILNQAMKENSVLKDINLILPSNVKEKFKKQVNQIYSHFVRNST